MGGSHMRNRARTVLCGRSVMVVPAGSRAHALADLACRIAAVSFWQACMTANTVVARV